MKISIYATSNFVFEVAKDLVDNLMQLSQMHYDGICRSASKIGGFLYGWNNMVTFRESQPIKEREPVTASCNFRTLDTLAKICEFLPSHIKNNSKILDFKKSIWEAMCLAQELNKIELIKE